MTFSQIEPLEARIAPASLSIGDMKITEGDSGTKTVTVTATLDAAATSDVTFTLSTQNGTAVAGHDAVVGDYVAKTQSVTIATGQSTATFAVTINGDTAFEGAESFFVNLTGAQAGVTVTNTNQVNPAAQATARVTLYNDDIQVAAANKLRWSDVDGDIVTLTVSKGSLFSASGQQLPNLLSLVDSGTTGGKQLQYLNLFGGFGVNSYGGRFAGANVSITATKDVGFPGTSDGRVDVGFIQAAFFNASELQVTGIDLGVVTVDGDLAQIQAGDQFSTPAIARLDVYSLGAKTSSLPAADANADPTILRTQSDVLGPIGTLNVKTNVEGFLHVVGAEFGTIGTVKIGGDLKGGALDNSGRITASGRIFNTTIGGNIIGGAGDNSGVISGTASTGGRLGNVTVLGDVLGGGGVSSGEIFSSGTLGVIKIGGKLGGSTGVDSGSIQSGGNITSLKVGSVAGGGGKGSGSVRAGVDNTATPTFFTGSIGAVNLTSKDANGHSLKGGTGENSGRIDAVGSILSFTTDGNVQGGTGKGSGELLSRSTIGAIKIGGNLTGDQGEDSGSIQSGGNVTSVSVGVVAGGVGKGSGSLRVGVNNAGSLFGKGGSIGAVAVGPVGATGDTLKGGTGVNSGQLAVAGNILSFTATGNVHGGSANGSGGIFAGGNIDKVVIQKSLLGGDSTASAFLNQSGIISALRLKSVTIGEDIRSGADGGGGIASTGSIRADVIDALVVKGNVTGNNTGTNYSPVVISARGLASNLAIKSVVIGSSSETTGNVRFAEILAGYDANTSYNATTGVLNFRGAATSADASIGTVNITGKVRALDIAAGADPGTDAGSIRPLFGTTDDKVVTGSSVKNDPALFSKIASVIISGLAADKNPATYGIVAQSLGAIKVAGTAIILQAGASNDRTPINLGTDASFNFNALELGIT